MTILQLGKHGATIIDVYSHKFYNFIMLIGYHVMNWKSWNNYITFSNACDYSQYGIGIDKKIYIYFCKLF